MVLMKRRFGDKGYFREPMKEWVSEYISPKVAKKLDNTIYLFLAYMVLFLIGVFIWGLLFGFGYLFYSVVNIILIPFSWIWDLLMDLINRIGLN